MHRLSLQDPCKAAAKPVPNEAPAGTRTFTARTGLFLLLFQVCGKGHISAAHAQGDLWVTVLNNPPRISFFTIFSRVCFEPFDFQHLRHPRLGAAQPMSLLCQEMQRFFNYRSNVSNDTSVLKGARCCLAAPDHPSRP